MKDTVTRKLSKEAKEQLTRVLSGKVSDASPRNIVDDVVYVIDKDKHGYGEDAVSIGKREENGQWIHIHISDVALFVSPDSPLDLFAQEFPRSRYLNESRTHMLPNMFCKFVALNQQQSRNGIEAVTFSALVSDYGAVLETRISPSLIPAQQLCPLSFYNFSVELGDGNEDIVKLKSYSDMLQKCRGHSIKDIDNFCVDNNLIAQTTVDCPGFHCVREMMLLSGFIAGNIANQMKIPLGFRENLGPVVQTYLESIPTWKAAAIQRDSTTGSIRSPNPIFYRHFAPVSSPLRKYSDLLNHMQLRAAITNQSMIPSEQLCNLLEDAKKKETTIVDSQNKDYRLKDLLKLQREIGVNGVVVGRVASIVNDVVSGRNSILGNIRLINYPKLIIPTKLKKASKHQNLLGTTLKFRITELSIKQNFIELELAK